MDHYINMVIVQALPAYLFRRLRQLSFETNSNPNQVSFFESKISTQQGRTYVMKWARLMLILDLNDKVT